MVIDWRYLAGFTDGEGCFYLHRCDMVGRPKFQLSQSGEDGRRLLGSIAEFLALHGIRASILKRPHKCSSFQVKPAFQLTVGGTGAIEVAKKLLPHLCLKKAVAQDLLRFRLLYPPLTRQQIGHYNSELQTGRKKSDETRERMSRSAFAYWERN